MRKLRIGSLFSGIGGLDKGLEDAGVGDVRWFCEADEYCRSVLRRHWPGIQCFPDVRTLRGPPPVDIICGGPPCQDLSDAGTNHERKGLGGERSGLARHMLRIIEAASPKWVVWENVDGAARKRWLTEVRGALESLGYGSLAIRLRSFDVGIPVKGSRLFVLATADCKSQSAIAEYGEMALLRESTAACRKSRWEPSPAALGVSDGVPRRMDRLRACGNAVVPALAEIVGRFIRFAETGGI